MVEPSAVHGTPRADELVVRTVPPGRAEHGAVGGDQPDIGLGGPPSTARIRPAAAGGPLTASPHIDAPGDVTFPCVGTKVAVVGGGSTYTPELVDSLCTHEDRLVVDELVLLDPDPTGWSSWAAWPAASWTARGWDGAPGHDRRPAPGRRRRRLRDDPAPGRGSGGPAHRRDPSRGVRLPRPGDDRAGWSGQGPAHRPTGRRDRRGDGGTGGGRGLGGGLHQSGGDRHPGPGGRGPPGRRAVQRGHPRPAPHRPLPRGGPRLRR